MRKSTTASPQKAPKAEKSLTMSDIVLLASRAHDLEREGHTPSLALLKAAIEELEATNDQ